MGFGFADSALLSSSPSHWHYSALISVRLVTAHPNMRRQGRQHRGPTLRLIVRH
ncbi:hypothetical protein CRENBAI_010189, partial [Crenichthys baileyi]